MAGEPARLLGQGHGVLPAPPARHRRRGPRRGDPAGPAPGGGHLAGRGAARASSTCWSPRRLPDDQHLHCTPTSCCPPPPGTRSTTSPPPTCTRSCTPSTRRSPRRGRPAPTSTPSTPIAEEFSRLAADAPRHPHRRGRRPAAARHRRRDWRSPAGGCGTGRPASASRSRARRCRGSSWSSATTPRSRRRWPRSARCSTRSAPRQGRHRQARPGGGVPAPRRNGAVPRRGRPPGGPSLARDVHLAEAILALSGTTNGRLAVQGWQDAGAAHRRAARRPGRGARRRPDHLRRHPGRSRAR